MNVKIQYMDETLTETEILMLKGIVSDRIEQRFDLAGKHAQNMDSHNLALISDEITRLEILREKLEKGVNR